MFRQQQAPAKGCLREAKVMNLPPAAPHTCVVQTLAQIKEVTFAKSLLCVHFEEPPKRRARPAQKSPKLARKSHPWPELDLQNSTECTQQHFLSLDRWRAQGSAKVPPASPHRTWAPTNLQPVLTRGRKIEKQFS